MTTPFDGMEGAKNENQETSVPQKEPLFPAEVFEEPDPEPVAEAIPFEEPARAIFQVTRFVAVIKKIERQIAKLQFAATAVNLWLEARVRTLENQRAYIEGQIVGYMRYANEKTLQVPTGRLSLRKYASPKWGRDAELLAWVKRTYPADVQELVINVKTVETVNKKVLKEIMAADPETQVPPELFMEANEERLHVG